MAWESNQQNARPHLIIGLGGIGQDILNEVRRRVVDRYGHLEAAPWMRFLVIDTSPAPAKLDDAANLAWGPEEWIDATPDINWLVNYNNRRGSEAQLTGWLPPGIHGLLSLSLGYAPVRTHGRVAFFY